MIIILMIFFLNFNQIFLSLKIWKKHDLLFAEDSQPNHSAYSRIDEKRMSYCGIFSMI